MPNHGYHDGEPVSSTHGVSLKRFDLRVAAEFGYTFTLQPHARLRPSSLLRVGLFAEYSLLNLHPSDNTAQRTTADWTQYLQVDMTHIYASEESNASRVNLLVYGIRLTALLPVSGTARRARRCSCVYYYY